jgi:endonuclease IV
MIDMNMKAIDCYIALSHLKSIEEKLNLIIEAKNPEVCWNLSHLFSNNKDYLNKLSEVILESLNDYYIRAQGNKIHLTENNLYVSSEIVKDEDIIHGLVDFNIKINKIAVTPAIKVPRL